MRLALEPEASALAAVARTPEQKRSIQCAAAAIAACGANEARLALVRGDNQGERAASIRMRMRRGWADGVRA